MLCLLTGSNDKMLASNSDPVNPDWSLMYKYCIYWKYVVMAELSKRCLLIFPLFLSKPVGVFLLSFFLKNAIVQYIISKTVSLSESTLIVLGP